MRKWCDVPTCRRTHYGRGLCHMHYQRWHKHGDNAIPARSPIVLLPQVERFSRRVITAEGCWEWTGATNGVGYGVTTIRYRRIYMHRLAYQCFVGPIPEGMVIDHLCRNTLCFNPAHLEAVTNAENIRRSPLTQRRSHCIRGHAFTPENTYVSPAGARSCRACRRMRSEQSRRTRRLQERSRREAIACR